jgi:hypothetical protein
MRPSPAVAKQCRLSEGCRRRDAWARIRFGAIDAQASLLFDRLLRNEGNMRLTCSCADRLGIVAVILLPSHKRLYILRADESDLMAKSFKLSCPVKSAVHASTAIVQRSSRATTSRS